MKQCSSPARTAVSGIAVQLLHTGFVATELVGGRGDLSPAQAAQQLVQRIDSLELAQTGTFLHGNGTELPW